MALIKCLECGHEVSDKAVSCPQCGCPILRTKQIICSECGSNISQADEFCPNCGCPNDDVDKPNSGYLNFNLIKKFLILFVAVLVVVGLTNYLNHTSNIEEGQTSAIREAKDEKSITKKNTIETNKEIESKTIVGTYYFNPCKDNYASVDMYDGLKWWKERKLIGYIKWSEYLVVMEDLRVSLLEPNRKSFVGNVTDIKDGAFIISINSRENATDGAWTPVYRNGRKIGNRGDEGYGYPKNIVIDTNTRRIYNGVDDYKNRDISDVSYIMYDRFSSTIKESNNTDIERTYLNKKYEREYGE